MTFIGFPIRLPVLLALGSLLACAGCPGTLSDPASFEVAANEDAGAGAGGIATADASNVSSCPDVPTTLAQSCGMAGCHDATTKAEGLDLASPNVAARLLGVASVEGTGLLINPGAPASSVIYTKLLATPPFGARMPTSAPLDEAAIQCVLAWVTSEAGSGPSGVDGGGAGEGGSGVLDAGPATDDAMSFAAIRVAAGQTAAVTDGQGNVWSADADYTGGTATVQSPPVAITGTDTPALYNGQRYGDPNFSYQFAVPNGAYTVTMKFAEQYVTAAGMREFGIAINGTTVETNFDIYAAAGGMNIAVDRSFGVTATGGMIQIAFTAGAIQSPKVDAIQITQGSVPDDGGAEDAATE